MSLSDEQRAALRSVRLNWAPTYEEVWDSATELHVDGLHTGVWEDLEDALGDAVASTGGCPTGLVITGNAGTGKTHLLTRFRTHVQHAGHYFVLLELLDVADFWRAALTSLRSSLLRPALDHDTQLSRLIWLLSDEAGLGRAHRREFAGDAVPTPEGLDALVTAMSRRRPQVRHYHGVLRALVLLAAPDTRLADLGSAFLDNIEVEETAAERLRWGLPAAGFSALETVRAISAFMAETGATVFAIDQIDTLLAQSAATLEEPESADGETVDRVGHGLMALRQGLYRTVSVACMLPTAWETLQTRATASVQDRFRVTGPLATLPDGAVARAIVERRLAAAYRARGFTPPHPTWPVAPEAFTTAVHHTPRDILTRVDAHIRSCLATRTVFELSTFDDSPTGASRTAPADTPEPTEPTRRAPAAEPEPEPDGAALARLDAEFEELRIRADVSAVATDQKVTDQRMAELIEAGLRAWTREDGGDGFQIERGGGQLNGRLRRSLPGRVEDEQHWSFRAVPAPSPLAVIKRVQEASIASGLATGVDRRRLFLLRSTPWPTGPKTGKLIEETLSRGAAVLPLDEADLATLAALARLIARSSEHLDEWLGSRRPAHGLRVFAGLPGGAADPDAQHPARRGTQDRDTQQRGTQPRGAQRGIVSERVAALSSTAADVLLGTAPAREPATPTAPAAPTDGAPTTPSGPAPSTSQVPGALPPDPGAPIVIGLGPDGAPVPVAPRDLRRHTAIFAGSGSGKTVLIRRLVEECALRGVSAIVLDPNNDLSRLGSPWPQAPGGWWPGDPERAERYLADTDVVVWTPNVPSARPLVFQPIPDFPALRAGIDGGGPEAAEGREGFERAIGACLGSLERHAGVGSTKAEQQRAILREALTAYGLSTPAASLTGFIDFLRGWDSLRSKLPLADKLAPNLADNLQAAMINNPLLGGAGEPVDPARLLTPGPGKQARVSVISLVGLPDETQRQTFIAQLELNLFAWIRRHPATDRPLGWLLVLDEAQQIAPAGAKTPATDATLLLFSQARKYGLGLVAATQSPKGVHNHIVGNSSTHFYGKINAPAQIQAAKDAAAARGGDITGIGGLGPGDFFLGAGAGTVRVHAPNCLSSHPTSPPTEDEVLAAARATAATRTPTGPPGP